MLICGLAPSSAGARSVPFGFFGTFSDLPTTNLSNSAQARERTLMVRAGVESVRVLVNWQLAQGYKSLGEVPRRQRSHYVNVGGIPTDFRRSDKAIGIYAARGLRVLPVVAFSPPWASANSFQPGAQPSDLPAYGRFLTALVNRYGPRGTFWRHHSAPRRARVRQWQIWNEEDLDYMWTDEARNFAPGYVALLRRARTAIKAADPGARIVLGGLTGSVTWPRLWEALDAIYRAGGRGLFDVAAVHPYTSTPEFVLRILDNARAVMNRNGDGGVPLVVTEFSWSSRRGHARRLATWEVSRAQQAANLARAYQLFAANRRRLRLEGAYWYSWLTDDRSGFWWYWTGLRRRTNYRADGRAVNKPALKAFSATARRYEGCHKRSFATRCG